MSLFWIILIGALTLIFLVIPGALIWRHWMRIPVDEGRRRFLKRAAVYPAVLAAASSYGGMYERVHTVDRRYTIPVPAASGLNGYRIAQISDVHLGPFFSPEDLRRLLERIAADGPDLLAVTGDLFDDVGMNPDAARILDRFTEAFPDGIWFCLGNHEHHRGVAAIKGLLASTRVHALYNDAEQVPGRALWIAGVDFPMIRDEAKFQQFKADFFRQAVGKIPRADYGRTILLAHHPEFFDNAAEQGIPLTLAGHTHGSQFGVLGMPLFPIFKYTRGMIRRDGCCGYVHCGNGSWFPCRIGCPPEIAYMTLSEG